MKLGDLYAHLKTHLDDHEARLLIAHHTGFQWVDILTNPDQAIPEAIHSKIQDDLKRRLNGEPLSRIHATREFWGLKFMLSRETLDPRPDTEVLVERALAHFGDHPPAKILDLGTGSGCILIALLTEWKNARGVAVDLSPGALETARRNAQNHKVADRIHFICGSWNDSLNEEFDLIVSNPPYIKHHDIKNLDAEVQNHDPILALDGGNDGLDAYRKIFSSLPVLLKSNGRALLEIGFDQEEDMKRLSKEYRIRIETIFPDYAGRPRVVDISRGDK